MKEIEIKECFFKNVEKHQLQIIKDDNSHRHLIMTSGSHNYRYEIITWPNYLCFCGDMGTFVFSRLEDMFNFFRSKSEELEINSTYWHEKLESVDKLDGSEEYSPDLFSEIIKEIFDNYVYDKGLSEEESKDLWTEIENEILWYSEEEGKAREVVDNFEYKGFKIHDFWEQNLKDYTYRYIWCLYAIVYTIKLYDKEKIK